MHGNSSQYLEMHAKDPVLWQSWSAEVLETAKQLNKPILISSGYFACHWCHVMQQENYQNSHTAKLINQDFIAVKIDRELNPDLDAILIDFAKKSTGRAGWPQHVVLTPEGYPFSAFIYLPNTEFNAYLNRTAGLWKQNSGEISVLAKQAAKVNKAPSNQNKLPSKEDFKTALFQQVLEQKDDLSGGLKSTAKFPKAPLLNALLTMQDLPEEIEEWLEISLDQMQSEHLFDHIHGGFYRYTVDPEWQTPHFEKMAYNSALLAQSYLLGSQRFNRPDYLQTAKQTLSYLRTHLFNEKLGLYQSSQSAIDKDDIEGGDYIFSLQQLKQKLSSQEFKLVSEQWNLDSPAPYPNGWHPKSIDHKLWSSIKQKLQAPVSQIPKDHKSVLSWNGLVLNALNLAHQVTGEADYRNQAELLADKLTPLLLEPNPPRALSINGKKQGQATLEDYAFILQGLKSLSSNHQDTAKIEALTVNTFYQNGHWQFEAAPLLPTMQQNKILKDEALPSPAAIVACTSPDSINSYDKQLIEQPISFASFLDSLNCDPIK